MDIKGLVVWLSLCAISLSACTSPETPTTEVIPSPSPTISAVGKDETNTYPLSSRTGIAEVDVVLAAIESEDPGQLRGLFGFTKTTCTTAEGLGGPPKCRDGEADHTPLEVLPFLGSEGSFLRNDEIDGFTGFDVSSIHAVFMVSDGAYSDENYPAGKYGVLLLTDDTSEGIVLQVTEGKIIRLDTLFDITADVLLTYLQKNASEILSLAN